jgi:cellulose synthase/poly-beta-1,6-N-acetylglucosamine synthase-like glycosyltransferase
MKGAPVEQDMIKSAPPATIAVRGRPKMLLSIVVPCYNEDRRLIAVLEQLDHTCFEILYSDGGSHDQTPDILRQSRHREGNQRGAGAQSTQD